MKKGKKIAILGAGNVGATIAYTLTMTGMASEMVMIDINKEKSSGEALDIYQGTAFSPPVDIYAGDYSDAEDADVVILTVGFARKPGQTRIDLAQANVNIIKEVMGEIIKYAPDAIYIVVSNPVDILTYTIIKNFDLPKHHIIGSGTILDSARLRSTLAEHVEMNPKNVHAYVFGEHGDTSMVPWSLATVGGMEMSKYCIIDRKYNNLCDINYLKKIEDDVRTSGAKVISLKGATYYAIALSVGRIVECVLRDTKSLLTVSNLLHGQYGIRNVCLSLPYVVGARGIEREILPPLTREEQQQLVKSADSLKEVIASLDI